jgi:Tol biopolymer transport system component
MALRPGQILSDRYRIEKVLGEGGFGYVYGAADTVLSRHVAIKELRPELTRDGTILQRFRNEAVAASNLNHPNIVTVYDLVQVHGTYYLIMEYVAGGSVADLLARSGKASIRQTADIAIAVCDALSTVHSHGITHRDIKPGNILLTKEGTPKLTDFGIALMPRGPSDPRITPDGVQIGTAAYMSPEQAKGLAVDHRSDNLELIKEREPVPLRYLRREIPANLDGIVHKALAKEPDRRFQSAKEMKGALKKVEAGTENGNRLLATILSPIGLSLLAASVIIGSMILAMMLPRPPSPSQTVTPVSSTITLMATSTSAPAPAPIYVSSSPTDTSIRTSMPTPGPPTAAPTITPIPPSPTSRGPTPTASGGRITFASNRDGNWEIYVMRPDGSEQTRLTDNVAYDAAPSWSPDGTRIVFQSKRDGNWEIYTMNASGSGLARLTDDPTNARFPSWSSDGTRIAFVSRRSGNLDIFSMNADGSNVTQLTDTLADEKDPVWDPSGRRMAFASNRDGNWEIYTMNGDGSGVTRLTNNQTDDWDISWSPDGAHIAFFSNRDGNDEIYVMNADGSGQRNVTNNPAHDWGTTWSPDGRRIAFESDRTGNFEIYVMNHDGSLVSRLTDTSADEQWPCWSLK